MIFSEQHLHPPSLESAIDTHVLTVVPEMSVLEVIARLNRARVGCAHSCDVFSCELPDLLSLQLEPGEYVAGCVLVMEGTQLLGVFTERDVVRLTATKADLATLKVAEVMTPPRVTLTHSGTQDIFAALSLIRKHRLHQLPILNQTGRVIGIVTTETIRQVLEPAHLLSMRSVFEVMSTDVIQAPPDSTMASLARLMAQRQVGCVVITQVDAAGVVQPLGIITERDIVLFRYLELDLCCLQAWTVLGDALFCLSPSDSLLAVHKQMQRQHVRQLVVTGSGGLLGIVTHASLLKVLDPVEMYTVVEVLQRTIHKLEFEKLTLLEERNIELERQVSSHRTQLDLQHQQALTDLREWQRVETERARLAQSEQASRDERERVQQVLQENELRYQYLVELSPDAIFVQCEGKLVFINSAGVKLLGASCPEDLIGKVVLDFIHPLDRPTVTQRMQRLSVGEVAPLREEKFIRLDGTVVDVEVTASPFMYYGKIAAQAVAHDITGRKRLDQERQQLLEREQAMRERAEASEQGYRLLTEAIPQLVWSCNGDGQCDYLSQQWVEYTGIAESEQLGLAWLDVIHPDDRERTAECWTAAVEWRRTYDLEYRIRGVDGNYRWFRTRGLTIKDGSGRISKWFGTCTDIEDYKRAQEQLAVSFEREQSARREAEQANRLKDEFLAIVSHELRTPLNAILGWTRMLQRGNLTPDAALNALSTIERNARAQNQLINDILDVSRIITGKLNLDMQPVEPVPMLDEALDAVRLAAEAKGIALKSVLDNATGPVLGDVTRLQQVVWNLLSNAIKFTPEGGWVELRLERTARYIVITVRDNGQGIELAFLPHIFERFRQADSTTTRRHGGLGLGLSIVHHLVELHGGTVEAASPGPGQGAAFTVCLPLEYFRRQVSPSEDVQPMVDRMLQEPGRS